MATRRHGSAGNNNPWVVSSLASGLLYGLMAFFLKVSLTGFSFTGPGLLAFVSNPVAWLTGIIALAGFLLMQKALHGGNVTIVVPVIGGISIVVPVLLAFAFLGEAVTALKAIGIVLIIVGTTGLGK